MAPSWGFQGKCLNNWVKCGSDIRVSLGIPSLCVLRNDVIWDMSLHIFNNREHSNTNTKPLCISKGFLYKGEQSSLGILRSKPTPPALHATVRHTPDCTLRRTLRFGSDSRWMQRSITSLVMLRWEGSSAFTSGPSRSSTSSHSAGGGTSGDSDGEMDDIWLTDLANVYPHWQVLSDRTATTIWNHTIIKNHFLFCPHTPIWIT